MFKIEAIIQPFKLDSVRESLKAIGIDGITVSEVRGHGRQLGHKEVYRGREYDIDLLPKIKLEMVVPAARKDEVIRALVGFRAYRQDRRREDLRVRSRRSDSNSRR